MKNTVIILIFFSLNCIGPNAKQKNERLKNPQIETIDLNGQLESKTSEHTLSEAIETLDLVPLEMTKSSLISDIKNIIITTKYIFILDNKIGICRFDRTGKYLNKIGKRGEGPGEYQYIESIQVDKKNQLIYLYDPVLGCIYKYNYDGKYLDTILRNINEISAGSCNQLLWNNKYFLTGTLPVLFKRDDYFNFILLDDKYNTKKSFHNPEMVGKNDQIWENRCLHYGWKNYWTEEKINMSFYDNNFLISYFQNDTIYKFDEKTENFNPEFYLKMGEKPTFEESHKWIKEDEYFNLLTLYNFYETNKYIYFQLGKRNTLYILKYDKYTKEISSYQRETRIKRTTLPGSPNFVHKRFIKLFPFKNDFCGGTFEIEHESGGKYWIYSLTPEMIEEMNIEEIKKSSVKDQTVKQKYLKLLEDTKIDDNPILLIATLK